MIIGVAYYPEHWERERWETDARLMQEAGLNTVRLAEFAWVKMEPADGRFDFTWLDDVIAILSRHGIKTVLGTPTEAMPAWLALAHPDAVATDRDGRKIPYGGRRDNCPTSTTYRRLGNRVTEAMARHFAGNPAVIGWQIDNEFSGPYCFCAECLAAWQAHLEARFGTIDALNRAWGTIFWSHSYGSFAEVPLPRRSDGNNPSLELEHRRFHSRQVVSFQREHVDILRRIVPAGQFITHNMCGFFVDNIDYYELARDLDIAGLDYYYNNSPWPNRFNVMRYESAAMDLTRCFKKKNFLVTETPTGTIGSQYMLRNLRPLEMRRMNYQAVAHGADGILWFRWRAGRFGLEQLTQGVLGHDGVPGRRYDDIRRVARELAALAPALDGSTVRSQVAIVYTYENRWALQIQPNARHFDYVTHLHQYHRALKCEGVDVDFVQLSDSLDAYRVLILPTGYLLSPEAAAKLEAFVRAGGVLVVTSRSAVKDADNVPYADTLPGSLRALCGVRVDECEALLAEVPVRFGADLGGGRWHAHQLVDWVLPETASVLARHEEAYLQAFAAVTAQLCGKGRAYYVGTCFTDDEAVRAILRRVLDEARIARPLTIPQGVDCSLREKGRERFLFLMNHNDDAVSLDLSRLPPCRERLSDRAAPPAFLLAGGEVAVLHWQDRPD